MASINKFNPHDAPNAADFTFDNRQYDDKTPHTVVRNKNLSSGGES